MAVALGFLGAVMFRRRRQGILQLFSHLKPPSTSTRTPGDGSSPANPIDYNQVKQGCVPTRELPAEEVAREMDAGP